MTEITAAHRTAAAAAPSGARLGDRLRQLRVAAGLTQTELAGDRFSKEYVSQIERGKTRPTAETVEWLAARLGVDPASSRAASPPTSAAGSRHCSRAPRRSRRAPATRRRRRLRGRRAPRSPRRTRSSSRFAPVPARRGRGCRQGDVRTAIELLNGARALAEGADLLRRRPRRDPLPARRLPLQALEHLDRGRAARRGARARRALGPPVRPAPRRTSSTGAPAATAASATSRRRARTSSARSSSPRALDDRRKLAARLLPGVARRRAHGPLGARAQLRRARQGPLPGARRRARGRPAAEQPRRPQPPARQARRRRSSS